MNKPASTDRVVLTAERQDMIGAASTVEYCYRSSAAKLARFYRGRGYKVKTWTVEQYQQHLEQQ